MDEALAMCRIAHDEGTRLITALAHQNDRYPDVKPDRIRQAAEALKEALRTAQLPLTVFATAEVMVFPGLVAAWQAKQLVSFADRGQYLLVEMPHTIFLDVLPMARELGPLGVRLILAHAERYVEFLHDPGRVEALIEQGALVQASSGSVARPANGRDEKALKEWFRRGVVHLLGSDGHGAERRPPRMAEAYQRIANWTDVATADRICSTNGLAVFQGLPLRVPRPQPVKRRWFPKLW